MTQTYKGIMSTAECEEILQKHSIRPTSNRILVVKALVNAKRPVSVSELESIVPTIDKSNIFRALSLFDKNRMVHRIEDGSETTRYELCRSHDISHDEDAHAHFYCEKCQKSFCVEDVHIPRPNLPRGYELHSVNYVLKGICPECAKKR